MSRFSLSWLLIVALVLVAGLSACAAPAPVARPSGATGAPANAQATLNVLAVETFLADIAQNIAGDRLKIASLMSIDQDPHAFEPTPQDVVKIAQSQVLIVNGAGFEAWLAETIQNAGGQRALVEAAAGLTSRAAREGEAAAMSDAELADAMCASATEAQAATAGEQANQAVELPEESGLFTVRLAKQADGSYTGYLKYATDEAGDFQVASAAGAIQVQTVPDSMAVPFEKTLILSCGGLAQGYIVELVKDGEYLLVLSGFQAEEAPLLVGPAGGHHHHEGDPHFWLDPVLAITYVENIRDSLSTADPAGKEVYAANAAVYIAKLTELNGWIKAQVETIPAERRLLVTNHESFGYFADRYGFKIVGTVIPSVSSGASPSAQQLARLTDRIKATGAPAIFLETGANPQLARQLAHEVGVKAVTELFTHSITGPNGPAPTYIEMMKYNVNAIVEALK